MRYFNLCIYLLFFSLTVYCSSLNKKALIFGITGQDGLYLAEFLLEKGYEVHGVKRRCSTKNRERIEQLYKQGELENTLFFLYYGDLSDQASIQNFIHLIEPDEVYNLAAQSHVHTSFSTPLYTSDINGLGTLRILEAIREYSSKKKIRFYQASTSELFGKVFETPQKETTPFHPRSPYGVAKLFAYWITVNYREAYDLFACNGILFNHESQYREETFVTRKITRAACQYSRDQKSILYVGNLDSKRDWGYAKDYVEAMWLMLQQDHPDDYVIASGSNHSVREFIELSYKEVGVTIKWMGEGIHEHGIDQHTGSTIIKINPYFYRPTEVDDLIGDAKKAHKILNWKPKTTFEDLVKNMISADLENMN